MVGAGAIVFAVWGYVIAKHMPDREYGSVVTLNPKVIGPILGEAPEAITDAIDYLCAPDPGTTTPTAKGRRLIKIAPFEYQVVNGAKYRAIRDEETRKQQNREAQARFREKQKAKDQGKYAGKNPPPAPRGYEEGEAI